ncbi:MAG: FHA domain-containing protein [Prosthecobacter sp.]|uniref:FHA domain-containing protein n=1 Tax=Prosthecobacter sp. TaxID=1965333 RepID=UPI003901B513
MAKLTFVLEDGQEIEVLLAERITLGRGEDNDVVVDDDRVSKRHAELVRNADGSIQVFDANSTAGTYVNGERVRSHTIRHGDRLAFGPLTAVLDLDEPTTNGKPVKAGKIGTRKKDRTAKKDTGKTALPPEEMQARLNSLQQEAAQFDAEKTRLQAEVETTQKELRDWQERAEKERSMHHTRVEALRAEEERLAPMRAAVKEAEATHGEWLKSIQALTTTHEEKTAALQRLAAQHDEKAADLQRLNADEHAARHELQSLATHRDQELAHLQQIRAECTHDEAVLDDLRRQIAELEERSQESRELAEAREDQVKAVEKKLEQLSQRRTQIDAHIKELSGTEERLVQALTRSREAEAQHAALTVAIAALGQEQQRSEATIKELESRISVLQDHHQQVTAATDTARATQQRTEASLHRVQNELAARETDLATRSTELAAETQRLEETRTRRAEIERQCQELAATEQKLANVKQQLATTEQQLAEVKTDITTGAALIVTHQASVKGLEGEESAAKGRIEVLYAREKDLRAELTNLATSERSERTRFEEVRQLAAEAETGHRTQQQQLAASLDSTRRELADLVSRLTPLREWKEAMDQLYARLATLPQDSPEARDLWHEIEKEKAGLHSLIVTARTQARAMPLSEAVRHNASTAPGHNAAPEPRAAVGNGQESTLRSRLNHLRESVQREEARLESLRKERSREETRPRSGGPAAEAMLREHSRQLEAKIRQEEERQTALLRQLEASAHEEEKRREKITELERKLAELRADIAEAERQRSELRQQADLAHTELKNYESAIDRVMKKHTDQDHSLPQMPG